MRGVRLLFWEEQIRVEVWWGKLKGRDKLDDLGIKIKVEFTLKRTIMSQKESTSITTLSLTSALVGCGWSTPRPDCFTPVEKDRAAIVQDDRWA